MIEYSKPQRQGFNGYIQQASNHLGFREEGEGGVPNPNIPSKNSTPGFQGKGINNGEVIKLKVNLIKVNDNSKVIQIDCLINKEFNDLNKHLINLLKSLT